jgi:archaellum biogenesis ATPase FlaH
MWDTNIDTETPVEEEYDNLDIFDDKPRKRTRKTKAEKETEKMRFKEAMDQINALKVELQEVNLLNAKLLYTNKIFKAKNLTEDKKVKVLKAFDNAKDVKQAKVIFDTLSEGLIMKTPHINEVKGSASKASGLEPKATVQPIIESNDVYNRMRKLAGLI